MIQIQSSDLISIQYLDYKVRDRVLLVFKNGAPFASGYEGRFELAVGSTKFRCIVRIESARGNEAVMLVKSGVEKID